MITLAGQAYPEMAGQRDFYDQVWRDLNASGLTSTDSLHTSMSASGLAAPRTSEFGKQFIKFISEPE